MKQWKIYSLIMKRRKTYFLIGIGALLLLIVAIGTYVWSEPELEPWEQAAVAFWDAAGVHKDIGEAKKWVTPSLNDLSDFQNPREQPDKPGTVWVTWTEGDTPDEKVVWILYDPKNIPPYRANLRFTTVKKVNGRWLVDLLFSDNERRDVESYLKETEAEGMKWKEVTLD